MSATEVVVERGPMRAACDVRETGVDIRGDTAYVQYASEPVRYYLFDRRVPRFAFHAVMPVLLRFTRPANRHVNTADGAAASTSEVTS